MLLFVNSSPFLLAVLNMFVTYLYIVKLFGGIGEARDFLLKIR